MYDTYTHIQILLQENLKMRPGLFDVEFEAQVCVRERARACVPVPVPVPVCVCVCARARGHRV